MTITLAIDLPSEKLKIGSIEIKRIDHITLTIAAMRILRHVRLKVQAKLSCCFYVNKIL